MLKIIKFGADLTKFWQQQVGSFLAHPEIDHYNVCNCKSRRPNFTRPTCGGEKELAEIFPSKTQVSAYSVPSGKLSPP